MFLKEGIVSERRNRLKILVKDAFESSIDLLRLRHNIRESGRESLYYICGWML